MSSSLYRLGRLSARFPRTVLLGWLAVLLLGWLAAAGADGTLDDAVAIPGTEAQRGIDQLDERFPELSGTTAQLVFAAPEGRAVSSYREQVEQVVAAAGRARDVVAVQDPFDPDTPLAVSADGRYALANVQLGVSLGEVDPATVSDLEAAAGSLPSGSDLRVSVGGSIFTTTNVQVSWVEGLGVLVAVLVLAITFGSLLAAGLPLLTALPGIGISMAGILLVAAFTPVNGTTPTLALMIGLAVGIDYALFILSRHRGQLATGAPVRESIARSVATAGNAVVFAGATVIVALCGLAVVRIPFLSIMGFAAAAAVALAVAVALTALPALMSLAGERLRPHPGSRAVRHATGDPDHRHTLGARWVALVTRVPALTVVVVLAALAVAALPARDLDLALPDNGYAAPGTPQRETYDLITEGFGPGYNTPLLVTVDIIASTDPVGAVTRLADELRAMDGVAGVGLATPNRTADLGIVQVIPAASQTDPATAALVQRIRDRRPALERAHGVTDLLVTGHTAVTIDVSRRLSAALLPFGVVVVGLSLLLLLLVFRSVAVPVKAALGYLLSVGASFGAVSAVFSWGWLADALDVVRVGPVLPFLPVVLMGVLFGLAMDYEVFLVSRMREEYVHTGRPRHAVLAGFTGSARVVTSAAVIMICVFAAFVPHGDTYVKPIALGLAVGVFVDAFAVRMTLVPAVLALLGHRAWWLPRWLDGALPSFDVEGTALAHHLAHEAWVAEHGEVAIRAERLSLRDTDGEPVLTGVTLWTPPGSLLLVRSADPVARRALLACLAGRLAPTGGTLVVCDRVLPDESRAVVARAAFLVDGTGDVDGAGYLELRRLARSPSPPPLVVLDGLDGQPAGHHRADRRRPDPAELWSLLRALTRAGATVVAGCTDEARLGVPADGGPPGLLRRLVLPPDGTGPAPTPAGGSEEGVPCPVASR
ncbi:MAG: MMPL family transporter [Actinomycetales bacterium]|nr:MMPL family transporter [Actinomycetales bacterium]